MWLVGMDGNDVGGEMDPAEVEVQRRMLARRTSGIGIPPADQMPAPVEQAQP